MISIANSEEVKEERLFPGKICVVRMAFAWILPKLVPIKKIPVKSQNSSSSLVASKPKNVLRTSNFLEHLREKIYLVIFPRSCTFNPAHHDSLKISTHNFDMFLQKCLLQKKSVIILLQVDSAFEFQGNQSG